MSNSFETSWAVAHHTPLSVGFPRQQYWHGLPFPSPGDLPHPGWNPHLLSPALASGFFATSATWEAQKWRWPRLMSWLIRKSPDAGKDWRQEKGKIEDEMVGWHQQLKGPEFEETPGNGEGQGSLACCSPWGRKEPDSTEQLNWTELNIPLYICYHIFFINSFLDVHLGCFHFLAIVNSAALNFGIHV